MALIRFRAPAWAWVLTATGVALFCVLGTWQLQRGFAKAAWLEDYQDPSAPVVAIARDSRAPAAFGIVRASVAGSYESGRQLLLDGQSHAQRPGYHVWTPMRLSGGGLVLVDRGWIPRPAGTAPPQAEPALPGEVALLGYWRSIPQAGIRVGDGGCAPPERWPAVVVYPQTGQVECLLGEKIVPGLFLLAPGAPGGFVREWTPGGLPPERHYGYAVQWYALGATAVVLFVVLNLRRPA